MARPQPVALYGLPTINAPDPHAADSACGELPLRIGLP